MRQIQCDQPDTMHHFVILYSIKPRSTRIMSNLSNEV